MVLGEGGLFLVCEVPLNLATQHAFLVVGSDIRSTMRLFQGEVGHGKAREKDR